MGCKRNKFLFAGLMSLAAGCLNVWAQQVEGMVRDSLSGDPVPFATLQYGKEGVITNEEGYFQFPIHSARADSLTVSCLGYRQKKVPITHLKEKGNTVWLSESVIQLNEVFLTNRTPDVLEILAKIRARVPVNYQPDNKEYRLFSRETEYVDFEDLDFQIARASGVPKETLYQTNRVLDSLAGSVLQNRSIHFRDFLGTMYCKDREESKLLVEKATSLLDTKRNFSVEKVQEKAKEVVLHYLDSSSTYKMKSGLFKLEDSLSLEEGNSKQGEAQTYSSESLGRDTRELLNQARFSGETLLMQLLEPGNYDFRFARATFFNEELIYVLEYQPRRGRSKYSGTLYVNGNDYAVVRLSYGYAKGKRGDKLNLKWLAGIKFLEDLHTGTILFRKGEFGTYFPAYMQQTHGSYFYVSRPVTFIENSREKARVTFDILISGRNRVREELLITRATSLRETEYEEKEETGKIPVVQLKKYDATLWQQAETLQPLREMKEFNAL